MAYKIFCCDDGGGKTVGMLIRFENVVVLVDPGWQSHKVSYEGSMKYWSDIIPEVDVILLSQPTTECLGAYAMLYNSYTAHFKAHIEVYATLPISNLGRLVTIEQYMDRQIIGPTKTNRMDLDDIEKAFDHIRTIKYAQTVDLRSKYDGLSLFAYNSGVSPGGTIWCINTFSEKLIYARRWNHTRDMILNGASIIDNKTGKPLGPLLRPSAIITTLDKFGSSDSFNKKSKDFKELLKSHIQNRASIIIPVDIGSKMLDFLVLIHDFLHQEAKRSASIGNLHILIVSYSRGRVLTYAKSMLEWLSPAFIESWEANKQSSPFELGPRFKVVSPNEVGQYQGPKICLVSDVDSLVDDIMSRLSKESNVTVLLLSSLSLNSSTTLSKLYDTWRKGRTGDNAVITLDTKVEVSITNKKELKGQELSDYKDRILKRRETSKKVIENATRELLSVRNVRNYGSGYSEVGMDADVFDDGIVGVQDDEEDDDDEEDGLTSILSERSGIPKKSKVIETPVDICISNQHTLKQKMFPFNPLRKKKDDYGEVMDYSCLVPKNDDQILISSDNARKRKASELRPGDDKKDGEDSDSDYSPTADRKVVNKAKDEKKKKEFDNVDHLNSLISPSSFTKTTAELEFKGLSIAFLNLDGLVDQRSASVIWPFLKSRKMILLGPKDQQNEQVCASLTNKEIDLVKMLFNQDLEFDSTVKSLNIAIDPQLDQLIKWKHSSNGFVIAHVVGQLMAELPVNSRNTIYNKKLTLKPLNKPSLIQSRGSLAIGDVKLVQLKKELAQLKLIAEFRGEGILVVNEEIMVKKLNDGETIIEGPPSELFLTVKKLITNMLATI